MIDKAIKELARCRGLTSEALISEITHTRIGTNPHTRALLERYEALLELFNPQPVLAVCKKCKGADPKVFSCKECDGTGLDMT